MAFGLMAAAAWAGSDDATATPARLAAAREMVEASGAVDVLRSGRIEHDIVAQVLKTTPSLSPEDADKIEQAFREELAAEWPTLIDGMVKVYAKHFTEADLRAIVDFYHSEAGRHLVEQTPAIATEGTAVTMPFMLKLIENLKKRLGDPASAASHKTEAK